MLRILPEFGFACEVVDLSSCACEVTDEWLAALPQPPSYAATAAGQRRPDKQPHQGGRSRLNWSAFGVVGMSRLHEGEG